MSRITPLLRAAVVAAGAAALLAGCVAAPPAATPTPKPTPDFGTIGGETPVPIETDTPVEPVEPNESGYVSILDDLGVVTVTVPEAWDDIDGSGFTSDAGQTWAFVAAAEDLGRV